MPVPVPLSPFYAQITFEDVAVRFTEEEWCGLQDWQRNLYIDVIMETYAMFQFLGNSEQGAGWHLLDGPPMRNEGVKPDLITALEKWRDQRTNKRAVSQKGRGFSVISPQLKKAVPGEKKKRGERWNVSALQNEIAAYKEIRLILKILQGLKKEQRTLRTEIERSRQEIMEKLGEISKGFCPDRTSKDPITTPSEYVQDLPPSPDEPSNYCFPNYEFPTMTADTPVTNRRLCSSPLTAENMLVFPEEPDILKDPTLNGIALPKHAQIKTSASPDLPVVGSTLQTTTAAVFTDQSISIPTLTLTFPSGSRTTDYMISISDGESSSSNLGVTEVSHDTNRDRLPGTTKPKKRKVPLVKASKTSCSSKKSSIFQEASKLKQALNASQGKEMIKKRGYTSNQDAKYVPKPTRNSSPPPKIPRLAASHKPKKLGPCLPDIKMCSVSDRDIKCLHQSSKGSLLRFAGLVFRTLVPMQTYLQWCHVANYNGTHQKKAIPQNVKKELLSYMEKYFSITEASENQQIRDGVNNQLRNPRKTNSHPGVS
ncbi:uncharacterized protein LOC134609261 [Pelobates fuscus]|uniref:uncharacterized protein LOC134609261 n=1 Tax=Pelobates fuscus TaxID=191477 RepID=UPI002FE4F563